MLAAPLVALVGCGGGGGAGAPASPTRSQFVEWTWPQVQLGDQGVYAVPQDTGPMAMFYRKDLFDAAGIAPPATWEEYYQAAQRLKAANPDARITHFPQQDANWFTGLLWQNQARLSSLEGDQVAVSATIAVFASSQHPAEAARFALWLNTGPASLEILNREGGLYPAATAGQSLPALSTGVDFYGGQPIFDVFREASGQVDTGFTWGPNMTDTYRFMSDGFTAALNGQGTLAETLGSAQRQTVDALRAQGVPVSG